MSLLLLFSGNVSGGYTLTANAGAYQLTGQSANLLRSRLVTAAAGAYTLTGQSASVLVGRQIAASAGAYLLAGQAATIAYTPSGAYTITAEAGAYSLGGQAAGITYTSGQTWGGGKFQYPNWQPYIVAKRDWEQKVPPKVAQVIERIARTDKTPQRALAELEYELEQVEDLARYQRLLVALMESQFHSLQALRRQQLARIARQEQDAEDEEALLLLG